MNVGLAEFGAPPKYTRINLFHPSPLAMPRSILVRPKGGVTGKVRRRYVVIEKIMLLEEYGRLLSERNLSQNAAAEELGIHKSLLSRWKKDIVRLRANKKLRKFSIFDSPNGQLHSIEEKLLQWIFAR